MINLRCIFFIALLLIFVVTIPQLILSTKNHCFIYKCNVNHTVYNVLPIDTVAHPLVVNKTQSNEYNKLVEEPKEILPKSIINITSVITYKPRKLAIFSCTIEHKYSYLLPITATLWHNLGFTPAVILIGTELEWNVDKMSAIALSEYKKLGDVLFWYFPIIKNVKFQAGHQAQISRLLISLLPGISDDDYLMIADVDLWIINDNSMLSKMKFDGSVKLHVFSPDIYLTGAKKKDPNEYKNAPRYAMVYAGAMKSTWNEIIHPKQETSLSDALLDLLTRPPKDISNLFAFDEFHLAYAFTNWSGWPKDVQFIDILPYTTADIRLAKYNDQDTKWNAVYKIATDLGRDISKVSKDSGKILINVHPTLLDAHIGNKNIKTDWIHLKIILAVSFSNKQLTEVDKYIQWIIKFY